MIKFSIFSKWLLRISIIGSMIYTVYTGHWVGTSGGALIFAATFLVDFLNRKKVKINPLVTSIIYIYCIFSLVLGNMWDFYDKIVWWDILMHILSGVILGIIGNYILNKKMTNHYIPSLVRFLFILGVACLGGVVWEIYEFSVDAFLNLDTQLSKSIGISDTMWDLITDLMGGLLSALYYIYKKQFFYKK